MKGIPDKEEARRFGKILAHKPTIRRSPFCQRWECIGRGVVETGDTIDGAYDAWLKEYGYRSNRIGHGRAFTLAA